MRPCTRYFFIVTFKCACLRCAAHLSPSTRYNVCVVDHVLAVYSFDSMALHMDGLNQIPRAQWRVMFNGAEVTLQQLLWEKKAAWFSDDVWRHFLPPVEAAGNQHFKARKRSPVWHGGAGLICFMWSSARRDCVRFLAWQHEHIHLKYFLNFFSFQIQFQIKRTQRCI